MNQTTNQPIASISYEWTEEYYKQFADTLNKSLIGKSIFWFFIVWFVLMALLLMFMGGTFNICVGTLLGIIAIYMVWNKYNGYSYSSIYKSCKIYQGLIVSFDFYDNYFVVSDKFGTNTLPYDILYSVKSSKFGYVLCTSKLGGYFIPKGECSDTLIHFINNLRNA